MDTEWKLAALITHHKDHHKQFDRLQTQLAAADELARAAQVTIDQASTDDVLVAVYSTLQKALEAYEKSKK